MKIGMVSNWYGRPQGHCYVSRDILKILLEAGHEVHMYRIGNNDIDIDFPQPTTMTTNESRNIPKQDFENWLDKVKPEWCIFNEYLDWWTEDHDKLDICKERAIKTTGLLIYERMDLKDNNYDKYDKAFCLSKHHSDILNKNGYNSVHIPWGINFEEMDNINVIPNDKITYYHCAGAGGAGGRKNTQAIVDAYNMIKTDNTELIITHTASKVYSRDDILKFIKLSDVVINCSKWESLGLGTLEANACGKPVIVCDGEPMNELVEDGVNGYRVKSKKTTDSAVTCPAYEVDVNELAKCMKKIQDKLILDSLKKNAIRIAKEKFDWKKNKNLLLEVLK